jgi:hypothetical protein
MKCVCRKTCQIRMDDGSIKFFHEGAIQDFVVCPTHFEPMGGDAPYVVNFDTAGEQELLAAEFELDALRMYIETKYDRKPGNRGKEKLVEMLMDCRFREVTKADLNIV